MSRLNAVEYALMNNPVRRLVQRTLEMGTLSRMLAEAGADWTGLRLLDAGCGEGHSTALLAERFAPARLVAFDLMEEQVARARQRLVDRPEVQVRVADVTRLPFDDGCFDGGVILGILHHVPDWRTALGELRRVLVPGGLLYVEDLHRGFVQASDTVLRTEHPREARFDWPTFREGLREAGLEVVGERRLVWELARAFLVRAPPPG